MSEAKFGRRALAAVAGAGAIFSVILYKCSDSEQEASVVVRLTKRGEPPASEQPAADYSASSAGPHRSGVGRMDRRTENQSELGARAEEGDGALPMSVWGAFPDAVFVPQSQLMREFLDEAGPGVYVVVEEFESEFQMHLVNAEEYSSENPRSFSEDTILRFSRGADGTYFVRSEDTSQVGSDFSLDGEEGLVVSGPWLMATVDAEDLSDALSEGWQWLMLLRLCRSDAVAVAGWDNPIVARWKCFRSLAERPWSNIRVSITGQQAILDSMEQIQREAEAVGVVLP